MLLTVSWEFPKLTIYCLILLLTTGCPLIHKYSTNSPCCAATASAWLLLAAWLNSLKLTNQPASYTLLLILPFSIFPLCAHTHLVRDLFLIMTYAALFVWSNLPCKVRSSNTLTSLKLSFEISSLQAIYWLCVYVWMHMLEFVMTVFWFFAL